MAIIGLILVVATLALGALAFYGLPTADTQIGWNFLGNSLSISPVTVFFIGAATMLGLLLGLWLLMAGLKRSARKSKELRDLKRTTKEQAKADAERQRLDEQRAREAHAERERTEQAHARTLDAEHAKAEQERRARAQAEQELRERSRNDGGATRA